MQRVETLSNLLAEKIRNNAPINELLHTVKMLESELQHLKSITPPQPVTNEMSAVKIATKPTEIDNRIEEIAEEEEEKTIEILQIDEAELEAELEEIKQYAAEKNRMSALNKQPIIFESVDEIPTLVSRNNTEIITPESNITAPTLLDVNEVNEFVEKFNAENTEATNTSKIINDTAPTKDIILPKEINESLPESKTTTLNDLLATPQNEVSDTLKESPIKDLKKAIGVNERFLYLHELFRGDEDMYERSIKTINAFSIYPEAEYWIRRELKLKLGWDDKYQTVKQFDQLIRRRFA
jgi:hypothetical protein